MVDENGIIICGVPDLCGPFHELEPKKNFLHSPAAREMERVKAALFRSFHDGATSQRLDFVELGAQKLLVELQLLPAVTAFCGRRLCTVMLSTAGASSPEARNDSEPVSFRINSSSNRQDLPERVSDARVSDASLSALTPVVPQPSYEVSLNYSESHPSAKGQEVESQTDLVWSQAGFRCTRCSKPPLAPTVPRFMSLFSEQLKGSKAKRRSKSKETGPLEGFWVVDEGNMAQAKKRWQCLEFEGPLVTDGKGGKHSLEVDGDSMFLKGGLLQLNGSGCLTWRRSSQLMLSFSKMSSTLSNSTSGLSNSTSAVTCSTSASLRRRLGLTSRSNSGGSSSARLSADSSSNLVEIPEELQIEEPMSSFESSSENCKASFGQELF